MAENDLTLLFGVIGIITAIAIAIFSPNYINFLDNKRRKKALKIALNHEIHKNFLECQEKKGFILTALPELEAGNHGITPTIHGFLHYSAYDAFVLSGFLIEEDNNIQELIENIYDEYHTFSHFLVTDRDIMSFFEGDLLRMNKIRIFNEILTAVERVDPYKIEFDSVFDVNK